LLYYVTFTKISIWERALALTVGNDDDNTYALKQWQGVDWGILGYANNRTAREGAINQKKKKKKGTTMMEI